jgi:GAF domain-containing protein
MGTLHGLGPFVRANPHESLLVLQSFVSATCVMALLFAALVVASRQVAAAPLLEERLRFERLLSELTAGLIHVPASGIDSALEAGLRDVVTFLIVDRGDLDEYLGGGLGTRVAWALPGLEEPPRVMGADQFPWAAERLRRGEVVRFSRVDELPEEAAVDRTSYQRSGTRSKVAVPLQAGGRVLGSLSFGSVRRERDWPDELVERLRLLSEAFASALERKRMDLLLAERLRFEKLLSNLTAAFRDLSVIDFDREIRLGLHRMVEFLAADRGSLIEFSRDRRTVRSWAIEEWMDTGEFPWLTSRLQHGDSVSVSALEELPHDADVDRRSYLAYRVKPRLAVPLVVGGTVVGGLVFSAIGAARASSGELEQQLSLLAEVFANALSRRQVELEAQRLRQDRRTSAGSRRGRAHCIARP